MLWIIIILIIIVIYSNKNRDDVGLVKRNDRQFRQILDPLNRIKYVEITYLDNNYKEFKIIHEVTVHEKVVDKKFELFIDSSIFADNIRYFKQGFILLDADKNVIILPSNFHSSYYELEDCGDIILSKD